MSDKNLGTLWQTTKWARPREYYFSGKDKLLSHGDILISHSLKYYSLRPDYILTRIEKLGRNYDLRILLVLCDVVCDTSALLSRIDKSFRQNIAARFEN